MAIPTWTVGQVLTASDVNSWFVPIVAIKTANESVTSSTTLQNDDALFIPLAATAVYALDCLILFDGNTGAADIKYKFTFPAGTTFNLANLHCDTPEVDTGANMTITAQTDVPAFGTAGTGVTLGAFHSGLVTTTGTAGSLQLQWAQNSSNATATRVLAGSYIKAQRVG